MELNRTRDEWEARFREAMQAPGAELANVLFTHVVLPVAAEVGEIRGKVESLTGSADEMASRARIEDFLRDRCDEGLRLWVKSSELRLRMRLGARSANVFRWVGQPSSMYFAPGDSEPRDRGGTWPTSNCAQSRAWD